MFQVDELRELETPYVEGGWVVADEALSAEPDETAAVEEEIERGEADGRERGGALELRGEGRRRDGEEEEEDDSYSDFDEGEDEDVDEEDEEELYEEELDEEEEADDGDELEEEEEDV